MLAVWFSGMAAQRDLAYTIAEQGNLIAAVQLELGVDGKGGGHCCRRQLRLEGRWGHVQFQFRVSGVVEGRREDANPIYSSTWELLLYTSIGAPERGCR